MMDPDTSNGKGKGKRRTKQQSSTPPNATLIFHPIFLVLFVLLAVATCISFYLVTIHPEVDDYVETGGQLPERRIQQQQQQQQQQQLEAEAIPVAGHGKYDAPHLHPPFPVLPVFFEIENGEELAKETLEGTNPTMAGIIHILQTFVTKLHESDLKLAQNKADENQLINAYFQLAQTYLTPMEEAYKGKSIFPVRNDQSIYVSLAAFREHLLSQTLQSAFDQAANPDKLFIGIIVQNCFGLNGVQCRTGYQVIGKDKNGRDQVKMSDAPPDENGVETFCKLPKYEPYCRNGQIRVLYIHDTDALGPAAARFYASKLWGGEQYFMQMDSHLEFAPHWDAKYIAEVQAAKNYPKAVLSSYPPGFQQFGTYEGGSPGARLCTCEFSTNDVESHIIRINTGGRTPANAPKPTQIAFIAAGFFFARAEFLRDVPFDPFVPWCFMGEEIALSLRAWTAGWNIYAPRQNLIAHQYRPGRLGLPKFWESVGRDSGRPNLNTRLQKHVIRRIKHLVGYPEETKAAITNDGDGIVLTDLDRFGLGTERTREAYLEFTKIDVHNQRCGNMDWCTQGLLL